MGKKQVQVHEKKYVSAVMTTGGNLVFEKDFKQYEVPASKQLDVEGKWGVEVIEPPYNLLQLLSWTEMSVIHATCVNTKVRDSVGIGWQILEEAEGEKGSDADYKILVDFFERCNEKEDITSVCKKIAFDYEGCGNGYMEVIREVKGGVKEIYHVSAPTIKLCKDKERWLQKIGNNKVYFKKFGDERILNRRTGNFVKTVTPEEEASELIQVKQYTFRSNHYGLPDWLPAIYQMFGEMKEKEFNLEFFSSFGIPSYAVIIEGGELNPDTEKTIQKYFETELKNNPHRTMVFTTPEGAKVRFEKLSVDAKEASFRVYRKDNRDDVLTAHNVPPYRASIVESGSLGGSVAEDVDRIYLDSVINPRQKDFTWVINELLIKEVFEIEGWIFEFEDIDIRDKEKQAEIDQKYFNMGARTPNEILTAQGKDPYEGGDTYYIPHSMIPVGAIMEEKRIKDVKGKGTTDKISGEEAGAAQDQYDPEPEA